MGFYKVFSISIILGVLLTGWSISFFTSSTSTDECANIFSSKVYADYHQQLNDFIFKNPLFQQTDNEVPTEFNVRVKELLKLIQTPLASPEQQRQLHIDFVRQLRELIEISSSKKLSSNEQNSRKVLEAIINWIYLEANLSNSTQEFIYQYIEEPKGDLLSYLSDKQLILHDDRRFDGIKHEVNIDDSYLHGNLPSVIFTLPGPMSTKVIRTPRPTRQTLGFPWSVPTINPEFLKFIQQQWSHIYVNLTKRHGQEGRAAKSIENLDQEVSGFHMITLDKNSDFYKQTIHFNDLAEGKLFKKIFLEQMTSEKGNYYWSCHLNSVEWTKELSNVVEKVHEKYFSTKKMLTRSERLDFIELTYLAILDKLIEILKPGSINISCHQCIDRGPSLLALWMLQKKLSSDKELAALLLGTPLVIHNRSSFKSRIDRFISASKKVISSRNNENTMLKNDTVENDTL